MPYRESTYHSERLKLGESRVILDGRLELHNKQKLFDIKLRSEESLDRSLHLTPAHKNVSNQISNLFDRNETLGKFFFRYHSKNCTLVFSSMIF